MVKERLESDRSSGWLEEELMVGIGRFSSGSRSSTCLGWRKEEKESQKRRKKNERGNRRRKKK